MSKPINALVIISYKCDFYSCATVKKHPLHLDFVHVLSFINKQPADRKRIHLTARHLADGSQDQVGEVHCALGFHYFLVGAKHGFE